MSKTGDDAARNLKNYLDSEHPVVEPIPIKKDEKKPDDTTRIKDVPDWKDNINDDFNEYDYSDDKEVDDKDW